MCISGFLVSVIGSHSESLGRIDSTGRSLLVAWREDLVRCLQCGGCSVGVAVEISGGRVGEPSLASQGPNTTAEG